ncbi:MAG: hypothetical protein HEQ11_07400 [Gemmatimonas sp.]
MTLFQAIVLGLVQGLTELLPVSSSAHLALTPYLLGWQDPGLSFDVALHFGTLVALAWYFRAEWIDMTRSAFTIVRTRRIESLHERRLLYLSVATIPAGIGGILLNDLAKTDLSGHPTSSGRRSSCSGCSCGPSIAGVSGRDPSRRSP